MAAAVQLRHVGLQATWRDPQSRDQAGVPRVARQIPDHGPLREAAGVHFCAWRSRVPASFVFSVAVQSRVMGWSAHTDHTGATARRARSTAAFRVSNEGSVQAASTPSTSHRATLASLGGKPSPRCYPGPGELLPLLTAVAPARLSTNTTTVSQDEG